MPFFSVIIPTYNRAARLIKTLQTVVSQSFTDFEIVVVDDGSQDDTATQVEKHFENEPRLRYFYKQNEERSAARNFGVAKAQGEFVVFFDSDDAMHPDHLQTLKNAIDTEKDVDFFATKHQLITQKGISAPTASFSIAEGRYDYKLFLKGNFFNAMFCVRKDSFKIGFPLDFNICEDWIFIIKNTWEKEIFVIDKVTTSLIDHDTRSMANHSKVIQARLLATEKIIKELHLDPDQIQTIRKHSYLFCAVHAYLDGKRSEAWHYLAQAQKMGAKGKGSLILWFKILVGKKNIERIKTLLGS
ncbi:glycosyltransferase family 2 protein [Hugenholtzia roseola]|uniref:glycosyltransferase family 2 protein n=1 Tax=Hugenholtzia roseola TaxID=1002 RepID=UPI000419F9F4|nr:glycosyltransferase family 2 protein [Hugenholtzia roseola]